MFWLAACLLKYSLCKYIPLAVEDNTSYSLFVSVLLLYSIKMFFKINSSLQLEKTLQFSPFLNKEDTKKLIQAFLV